DLPKGAWLADAGFGDGSLDPIRIVEGPFASNGFDYALSRVDDRWWRVHHHKLGGPKSVDFDPSPADEARLAMEGAFLQASPESIFVLNLVCFRQREGAVEALRGRVLRHVTPDGASDRLIGSAEELVQVLREVFGLDLPEAATLWPKIYARHEAVTAMQA